MGDPNPATSRKRQLSARLKSFGTNKISLIVGGLFVAALSASVLIQVFRAEPSAAADRREGGSRAGTAQVSGPRHVARVGDQVITYDALAAECVQRHGQEVLKHLINRTVIQQACLDRGINVSSEEVHREIQQIAQKFKLSVDTWYKMLQAERNLTPLQYQRDIIWPMLALRKIAGDEVTITEQDIQKVFERDYGPKVKAKMIMLDNQRRANEVWQKANRVPEDFGRLARKYSIEPTSRALDGAIPPIRKHVGSKDVWEEAFKLRPGEISPIIQAGPSRYVILYCEGKTEPVIGSIAEVRDDIIESLREEKQQQAVAEVFEQLKQEVRVDNFLTNRSTGGIKQTSGTQTKRRTSGGTQVPFEPKPRTVQESRARRPGPGSGRTRQ